MQNKIDVSRLQALEQNRDTAVGAARKLSDVLEELRQRRRSLGAEIGHLKTQQPASDNAAAEKKRRLDDLAARRETLDAQIADAAAICEAAAEKLTASTQLHDRCMDFVKGLNR